MIKTDLNFRIFGRADSQRQRLAREALTQYIKMKAPERYHSKLIPQFRTVARCLLFRQGFAQPRCPRSARM
jgi:hypothetical protein